MKGNQHTEPDLLKRNIELCICSIAYHLQMSNVCYNIGYDL